MKKSVQSFNNKDSERNHRRLSDVFIFDFK